ncbi:Acyl dehydratase [Pseudomonas sp. ok272]|uniref:MaoC family dehydratase n=1 Tax=unclassified Pseudomonas TaxID=196821 RepID=UPI0008BC098E|nr:MULTISPECIES: MaoC/PaaZ C-terminal domain-containing protein [unclassified Pseudomonas]SEN61906.1 Acyl dehydratase [Pseudomonas sp. ok272]SFN39954.1 Acyl dehydratase [Pseudomonas sp. ok602]
MTIQWQSLSHPPSLPGLYWRAATRRQITGNALPKEGLRCWVSVEPGRLAAYRKVCGYPEGGVLPATYPHVLAFGVQMHVLTADAFPFPLLGLVHLANRIRLLRPLGSVGRVQVSVQVHNLQPHPKGATFEVLTTLDDALGPLWEAESQMLCKGVKLAGDPPEPVPHRALAMADAGRWWAPSEIGRQYARVSGDYNPIHLSAISARCFGFPTAIAHGLWIKARALAALSSHLPTANVEIAVQFKKPVRLPSEVMLSASAPGNHGDVQLVGAGGLEHLRGTWRPLA